MREKSNTVSIAAHLLQVNHSTKSHLNHTPLKICCSDFATMVCNLLQYGVCDVDGRVIIRTGFGLLRFTYVRRSLRPT